MKITDIKVIMANSFMYVKVYTDEGIEGTGESGAWGFLNASSEAVESFKTYLIGQDPLQIEHHWQYMYRCFHFRGAAVMGAISAIDIALWDIAGKYFGVPVYQLLGGKCRDKVRTYYHVSGATTEELVQNVIKAKEAGYNAVGHLSPFLDEPRSLRYHDSYSRMIHDAVERVRLMREAVGDDMDFCLELHRRMKPGEAIAFAQQVEKYTPFFRFFRRTGCTFKSGMRSVRAGIHDLVGGLDGAAQEDCAQGEGHDLRDGEGPPHQLQPSSPGQQPRHRQ